MKRAVPATRSSLVLGLVAIVAGCIESPQTIVDYQAIAINDGVSTVVSGEWIITLSRAELAFGPVYFCAAAAGSSSLCASSVAELTTITRIDGLTSGPLPIGTVHGFTGKIQSASYDYGISWFDTTSRPVVASLAPLGHSVRLEGEARRGSERVSFTADVDVVPQFQGQRAIPTAPVSADVSSSSYRLEVHFDAGAWVRQLDFDAIAGKGPPFRIEPGSVEHDVVLIGIKNVAPPTFRWVSTSD
jgi:hypothetical protein